MKDHIPVFLSILFSTDLDEDLKLTIVNDTNRDSIADIIGNLKMHGGTCLGNGLMQGMDVRLHTGTVWILTYSNTTMTFMHKNFGI